MKSTFKKISALVLALVMVLAMGTTAFADDDNVYTGVNQTEATSVSGTTSIPLNKTIVIFNTDDNTTVREPDITFSYALAKVDSNAADGAQLSSTVSDDTNTVRVYNGVSSAVTAPTAITYSQSNTVSATTKGYEVLKDISIMPELSIGAESHHERPDGKGYPKGLKGDEIPKVAQIIAVADCFDAMYSNRPYRERMNFDIAVSIIKEVSGTQLSSEVVDAFLRLVDNGKFRAPDDKGGGSTENIDNIHKKFGMAAEKKS